MNWRANAIAGAAVTAVLLMSGCFLLGSKSYMLRTDAAEGVNCNNAARFVVYELSGNDVFASVTPANFWTNPTESLAGEAVRKIFDGQIWPGQGEQIPGEFKPADTARYLGVAANLCDPEMKWQEVLTVEQVRGKTIRIRLDESTGLVVTVL